MFGIIDIANIIDYVSAVWVIGAFLAGLLARLSYEAWKKYKFKKVLSLSRNKAICGMSLPYYRTSILDVERDVLVADEVKQMIMVDQKLAEIGVEVKLLQEDNEDYDEIHIGGPSVNAYTNRYFYKYLKNIRWKISADRREGYLKYNRKGFKFDYILESEDGKEGFVIGDRFYEFIPGQKGWALLVKIIDDKDIERKAIHLLFGAGANGTIGAVKYFSKDYTKIFDKWKDKEYFAIFEVNQNGVPMGDIEWLDIGDYFK